MVVHNDDFFFLYSYPERDQLQTIYSAYLEPVLHKNLKNHPIWGSLPKIHQLAGSMVQVYEQVWNSISYFKEIENSQFKKKLACDINKRIYRFISIKI